jgi:hypothetical protein
LKPHFAISFADASAVKKFTRGNSWSTLLRAEWVRRYPARDEEVIHVKDIKNAIEHLREHHTTWPATKAELVAECNNLSDFSAEDKAEFEGNLPDRTYNSPEEVIAALGLKVPM